MSGTSTDGVDAVVVDFLATGAPRVRAHHHHPFDDDLRQTLLALNQPGANEIHRAALAANALAHAYADAVRAALAGAGVKPAEVRAIGAHGQTVRHRPGEFDGLGYTVQLFNGALLAETLGIDVVCDFRSRDVAAGGQGAPLVPACHAAWFGRAGRDVAVLNLGGIANLTLLSGDGQTVRGFDCGPGNVLLDAWCEAHTGAHFDDGGRWGAQGTVVPHLLERLLADPFFSRPPPKSTGRDLFHSAWLAAALKDRGAPLRPQDVQATLVELTVQAAARALLQEAPRTERLRVCGGGAHNAALMAGLASALPGLDVDTTEIDGVPPDQVEALAFAWLAQAWVERRTGSLSAVTGARGPRVLGALYPAR